MARLEVLGARRRPHLDHDTPSKGQDAMAQQGDDPPAVPPPAESPDDLLLEAIGDDDFQEAERALSEGASVDAVQNPLWNNTALIHAVELRRNRIARLLIGRGADLHAQDTGVGLTALHIATQDGNLEMVLALTKAGADVNIGDNEGETPIFAGEKNDVLAPPTSLQPTFAAQPPKLPHRHTPPRQVRIPQEADLPRTGTR